MKKEKLNIFLLIVLIVLCVGSLVWLAVSSKEFETQQARTEAIKEVKVFHDTKRKVTCYWHLHPKAETCFPDSLIRNTER